MLIDQYIQARPLLVAVCLGIPMEAQLELMQYWGLD